MRPERHNGRPATWPRLLLAGLALGCLLVGGPLASQPAPSASEGDGLWVATWTGLVKLGLTDGLTRVRVPNTTLVQRLAVDPSRGRVWTYSPQRLTAYDLSGQALVTAVVPPPTWSSLFNVALAVEPATGQTWLGLGATLHRFGADGQPLGSVRLPDLIEALAPDPGAGRVWVATRTSVAAYDLGGQAGPRLSLGTSPRVLAASVERASGDVWIALSRGVRRYRATGALLVDRPIADVEHLGDDGAGGVWAASAIRVWRLGPSGQILAQRAPFSTGILVTSLTTDLATQSAWIGSLLGIRRVGPNGQVLLALTAPARVRDLEVGRSTATGGGNRPPSAVDDTVSTPEDTAVAIPVLGNDSDPDGDPLAVTGVTQGAKGQVTFTATGVTYTPSANATGSDQFTYTIGDGHGGSGTATVRVTITPVNDPPVAADDAATTAEDTPVTIAVLANDTDPDGDPRAVTAVSQGSSGGVVLNADGTVTYTPAANFHGSDSFTYTVSDGHGGTATATVRVTVTPANNAPTVSLRGTPLGGAPPLAVTFTATASDVDGDALTYVWDFGDGTTRPTGSASESHTYQGAGSFTARVMVSDGQATATASVVVTPAGAQDAASVAPPRSTTATTDFRSATAFLFGGPNPIQTGVAPGTIDAVRAAVIRGRVRDRAEAPVAGVRISVLRHPEFGQTLSRGDGQFDLAVNGGGKLIVRYEKVGYFEVQRDVHVPWQDFVYAPDVVLTAPDAAATTIDLAAATPVQVARGSTVTDDSGPRRATLLFPSGTVAQFRMPDGSLQPAPSVLTVRQTEYTVGALGPQAMPSELPPTSGYTYYLELSADEAQAAGAVGVEFNQPVVFYVENFLGFPVGDHAPVGFYDRQAGNWKGEPDGLVVQVVSVAGGLAELDTDGNGTADNGVGTGQGGTNLGITVAERQAVAQLYPAGQTLWRVTTSHFSPGDINWPFGPPSDAIRHLLDLIGDLQRDCPCDCPPCLGKGSMLETGNQTLGEAIPVVGTEVSLHYQSDRVPGRRSAYRVDIPLTGPTPPASLRAVTLQITVAGQQHQQRFGAAANQTTSFEWDGRDVYGRVVQGVQLARVRIGYEYPAVYQRTPADYWRSWAITSGFPYAANAVRQFVTLYSDHTVAIGAWDARAAGLGTWTLSSHHAYDPYGKVLHLGTGHRRRETDGLGPVMATIAGNGTLGIPADEAAGTSQPLRPWQGVPLVGGPDGSVYFINATPTTGSSQIWRLRPNGTLDHVAGIPNRQAPRTGVPALAAYLGDQVEGLALGPDGSLYYTAREHHVILRIRPGDQVVELLAGTPGVSGFAGDGGPATTARLAFPQDVAVTADGSVHVFDSLNHRIRRIGPDRVITTVAGIGRSCTGDIADPGCQSGAAALTQAIGNTASGARNHLTAGPDGSLYAIRAAGVGLATIFELYRIGPDGILRVIAGRRSAQAQSEAEDIDALQATLVRLGGLAVHPDGTVWYSTAHNFFTQTLVRQIGLDGIVRSRVGSSTGFGGDGGPARKASLSGASGIGFTADGLLVVSDFNNNRLRRVGSRFPGFADVTDVLVAAPDGSEVYRFDTTGRHLATVHGLTGATLLTFGYDGEGRLTSLTDGDGNVTVVQRDGAGALTSITGPFGQTTQLTLDDNGYLASVRNPAGETVGLTHGANGLLTAMTTPKGQTYQFAYDAATGHLLSDADPAGGVQILARTGLPPSVTLRDGVRITNTTALGRSTSYQTENLTNGGRTETSTASDGTRTVMTYRPDGSLTMTAPTGAVASVADGRDPRWGMLAPVTASREVRMPSGRTRTTTETVTATLADPTNLFSLIQWTGTSTVNGRAFTRTYDAAARRFTDTSAAGRVGTATIDALGRTSAAQFGGLAPAAMAYDGRGRLASITVGSGVEARTTTLTYDARSYLASITDPLGRVTVFTHDAAGRPVSQTLPDGRVIAMTYDANGNVASVTPPGRPAHAFAHSAVDLETAYDPPDVPGVSADTPSVSYDVDRRLALVSRPDGLTVTPTYDTAGRLASVAFSRGSVTLGYSASTGVVTAMAAPDGVGHAFAYDGVLLTQHTLSGPIPGTVSWTYDNDFRVATQSVNGANTVTFAYDADSLLTQAGALTLTRSPQHGFLTATTLGVVTDSLTYNSHGELLDYRAQAAGGDVYRTELTRDALGRISRKVETALGLVDTYDYDYDPAGRLIEVTKNGIGGATYTYDANGNRLSYTGSLGDVVTTAYDAQDRLTLYGGAAFTYDNHGDLTSKTTDAGTTQYTYDEFGNLTRAVLPDGTQLDYVIDGLSRRIGKKVNGVLVTRWLYDGRLRIVAELNGTGALVSRFVYATRVNVPDYVVQGSTTYRLITDYLGSPRLLIDTTTGAVVGIMNHDEYGRVTQDTLSTRVPFGYAGGLYDPQTGLVRFGARDYDAETGRWTTRDPIGFAGGSANLYRYPTNPITLTDPLGLACPCPGETRSIGLQGAIGLLPGVNASVGLAKDNEGRWGLQFAWGFQFTLGLDAHIGVFGQKSTGTLKGGLASQETVGGGAGPEAYVNYDRVWDPNNPSSEGNQVTLGLGVGANGHWTPFGSQATWVFAGPSKSDCPPSKKSSKR